MLASDKAWLHERRSRRLGQVPEGGAIAGAWSSTDALRAGVVAGLIVWGLTRMLDRIIFGRTA
jgi:hypothetical protein